VIGEASMKALEEEILKRIEEMEQEDYEYPKRFNKRDYIIVGVVALVSLCIIILGGFIA